MPRIAIDISPTTDANSTRGMGYYTKNLISALQSEIKTNLEFQNWHLDLTSNIHDLRSKTYDLIHYPYFDPYQLTLPSRRSIPVIVTVPDLITRQFRQHYSVGIKGEMKWLIQKHRLKQTDYILTISHYSKHIIKRIINYPQDKIYVSWLAANKSFKPRQTGLETIRQKYHLPAKFVLYVGDINWNKNIPSLVNACLSLKYDLVIVGSSATKKTPVHPWTKDILWLQSQKSPLIHLTGFVLDEDLPYFYNLATLYCEPSFAEGFGLPLVEAMQSGCPVAYSYQSCLNEIMDYNGEFFDPYSLDDFKTALKKLWVNESLRKQYSLAGIKRAQCFSWKNTAIQTLALYKLALTT